jgi:chromosome segregation ATPase
VRQVAAVEARLADEGEAAVTAEREANASAIARADMELLVLGGDVSELETALCEAGEAAQFAAESHEAALAATREAAQRAAEAAEAEYTQRVEAACASMRDEAEAVLASEREASAEQVRRLDAEIVSLKAAVSKGEADCEALREDLRAKVAELAELQVAAAEAVETKAALEALRREEEQCRSSLEEALSSLEVAHDKNASLGERVETLIGLHSAAQSEASALQVSLTDALTTLGITTNEKLSLTEQLRELLAAQEKERQRQQRIADGAQDAEATIARLEDELARFRDEKATREAAAAKAMREAEALRVELAAALKSLGITTDENRTLQEQVRMHPPRPCAAPAPLRPHGRKRLQFHVRTRR